MDSLTFIGTATTLIRLGPFTLLTDPNFLHQGQRAYLGRGLWSRRLTEPAMQPGDLPALDAVVLSHLHGDHFDRIARRELARDQPVITTPAAAERLARWGFCTSPLGEWESETLVRGDDELTVQSVPAVHARGVLGRVLPPVMGSILEHRIEGQVRRRLYLSGDTLTGPHVSEIARRFPDIDTAVVHLGGTRVLMHTVTMDAEQGVDFLRRVQPQQAVPVHYDDYGVFVSPLERFLDLARSAGLPTRIRRVARGATIMLDEVSGPVTH
jgi:L-ascorbate metabolism protein UlaG (beta-lactamase superfamily)